MNELFAHKLDETLDETFGYGKNVQSNVHEENKKEETIHHRKNVR